VLNSKFCYFAILLLLFASCRSYSHREALNDIPLIQQLAYAEKIPDSQLILFGTTSAKSYLKSGWSNFEKDRNTPFQWAVSKSSILDFECRRHSPYYLYVKMKSFFDNAAEIFLNNNLVGNISVAEEPEVATIDLPEKFLVNGRNVLEFRFSELKPSPVATDKRQLAAAVYFALVSPSKYFGQLPAQQHSNIYWDTGEITLKGKQVPAISVQTPTEFRFYQRLNSSGVFRFGTYYKPSPLTEQDDFADFSITLQRDGDGSHQIFHQRVTDDTLDFHEIPLSRLGDKIDEGIYKVTLRIDRNSSFNSSKTAWVNPILLLENSSRQTGKMQEAKIEELRKQNRNANVIVILLDAGAAKHFGCYGYKRNTTPNIDALAKQSYVFDHSYCQAVYTLASTASLMSGLYPYHHRIVARKSRLPSDIFTLAEAFDRGGYETGTFVANGNASGIFGMTQGFREIGEVFRDANYTGWGQDITKRFSRWLDNNPNKRFFAYLHYREPHAPFNPPPGWIEKFTDPNYKGVREASYELRQQMNMGKISATQADRDYIASLYDANLAYADSQVGEIIQKLKHYKIFDRTILIVTSDHGEAFWEHNFQGHNSQLYEESMRTPLVIKLSQPVPEKRISNPVRTIDMFPMLVDLLNFSRKGLHLDGKSYVSYFAGGSADGRDVISNNLGEHVFAYIGDQYKYIVSPTYGTEEMYNLQADPLEKNNVVKLEPVRAGYYRSQLLGRISQIKKSGRWKVEQAVIDESARENLKALGYVDE
jgi:arylsulfatase A-like enzyme